MTSLVAPSWDRWTYAARVEGVPHDGDTVRISLDLGCEVRFTTSVRLLGIQAPEVSGPGVTDAEKAAGLAARDRLVEILAGGLRPVVARTKKDTQEGRGRYLATLYVVQADGTWLDVCRQLVLEGHATPYDGRGKAPKWTPQGWRPAA